ncbi:alpha/beta hydrolase [Actinomadura bangladeshensis]|uniref:Alpha/beta hydrolase n=1 Tax=Actinomadura bangladeshensis TaxID=453573 RepID=A0A6L9QBJ7_9ACTN|nr:alpha/beta hydrolase [Actinomadura bangladeshensis]NEA22839.1 alpha/beta hydrolase [Actinomadura bangladeshensis]
MPLDPRAAGIAAAMTAGFPKVGTEVTDAVHARRILAAAPRPDLEPIRVAATEDLVLPGPHRLPVRIYWPHAPAPAPVVVFFHGGGFTLCGLDTHDRPCRALAADTGAIVVSVDYRLAPEHRFPAAADDARTAVAWAHAHSAAFGGDPERLAVAGDSAGGALAAVACLDARDAAGPPIAFQLLIYPVTDAAQDTASYREHAEGGFLTAAAMRWYWKQYLPDLSHGLDHRASPLRAADLSRLPPACVITADCDPLRDEGEAYAARLSEAGVPVRAHRFPGTFHGFYGLDHALPAAADARELAASALRNALA